MKKHGHARRLQAGIFLKNHSDDCTISAIELIDIVEKHNTLITINCGAYYFGVFE